MTEELKKQLNKLVGQRGAVKGKFTRLTSYLEQINIQNKDIDEIRVRYEELPNQLKEFEYIQEQIEELDPTNPTHDAERDKIENKYYSLRAALNKHLQEAKHKFTHNHKDTSVRLPKIELPTFSGEIREWPSFKNLFECAMPSELSKIQKLQYLKSCLRGEAATLISNMLLTDENYDKAIETLVNRYENKSIVVNYHLKNFLNYATITRNNIKEFTTVLQQSLDSLTALELPVTQWDVLLVYLITQKMDNSLRAAWELNRKETSIPTLQELKEFFKLRATAFEMINDRQESKQTLKQTPKVVHAITNLDVQCKMCRGNHFISKCPHFLELSVDKRIEYVKSNTLCYNCLQPYVQKHNCSKKTCVICHGRHHSLIHLTNPPRKVNNNPNTNNLTNNTHNIHTCITQPHESSNLQPIHTNIPTHTTQTYFEIPNLQNLHNNIPITTQNIPTQNIPTQPIQHIPIQTQLATNLQPGATTQAIQQNSTQAIPQSNTQTTPQLYTQATPRSVHVANTNKKKVLLSTALINIQDSTGKWHTVRAMLDNGSEVNIVTHKLACMLNCKYHKDKQVLQGVGDLKGQMTELCIHTNISSPVSNFSAYDLEFSVLNTITVPLPHNYIDYSKWNIPTDIVLADPNFHIPQDIDVLLGGELFFDYILSNKIKLGPKQPTLVETVFGWLVAGQQVLNSSHINSSCNTAVSLHMISQPVTEDLLPRFWQQEEVKPRDVFTPDQKYCEELFLNTTEQDSSGHYIVEMPINKNKLQELGDSFNIAYRSLLSLESRFIKNPELHKQYTAFIHELLELGHAEIVPDFQQQTGVHCYIPHLGVLRPDSVSTKLRSVVNASAKTSTGVSLNDILYEGPNIYNDILDIILKFRTYKYAFTCDIIKMFRTILIKNEQRPLLRILWRDSKTEPLQCLQFKTVIYGTKCAPYLACRTLKHMAQHYKNELPEAAEIVETQSYMDDFLSGRDTIEQSQEACKQLIELLGRGKFSLHKWSANDPKVLHGVTNSPIDNPKYDFSSPVKTLGIYWNTIDDTLSISVPELQTLLPTKRNVLSAIAQIYDPLGILQPVIIKAKILMQEIWKANIDWDQVLPDNLLSMWQEFFHGLSCLRNIKINRYYFSDIPLEITLLGFSDSSERAYGGCIYLKATYLNRKPTCSLVIAKTKVAPIKKQSLPRLELCGALMLAQLYTRVQKAFKNIVINHILLFTDSMIVLHWIKSPYGRKLHTYVTHRLMEIVELTRQDQWNYINTKSNPADMLTRGIQPELLEQNSFWFDGPQWVLSDISDMPQFEPPVTTNDGEQIEKVVAQVSVPTKSESAFHKYFQKFSSFTKLTRVIAYVYRFINKARKNSTQHSHLTTLELKHAHNFIIREVQSVAFSKELQELKSLNLQQSTKNSTQDLFTFKSSPIRNLNPFLSEEGIIRAGGRISNSDIPFQHAHPIILPCQEHVTTLIVKQHHERLFHAGIQNTLFNIRLKYWILKGRQEVKKVIHGCVRCLRYKARTCEQQMASLPLARVTLIRAFAHVGVDFSGAILLRTAMTRSCRYVKGYICLFVCMSTKALHLELVGDLSSQAFICALKRFVHRRGNCLRLYSDNATNFKGANNELQELYKLFQNDKTYSQIIDYCNTKCIEWKFTVPLASHMGGIYEAGIKSVKALLKRHLGNARLTYELLNTVLVQIEGILNSRPLYVLPDTLDNDINYLTPSHFLTGDVITDIPEPNLSDKLENRLSLYQKMTQIKQKFWKQFYDNYLSELQPRHKWLQATNNLNPGDIVILKEESTPPACWPLGKIITVNMNSKDKLVRSVVVKTSNGEYTRPVNKLILLPCSD